MENKTIKNYLFHKLMMETFSFDEYTEFFMFIHNNRYIIDNYL